MGSGGGLGVDARRRRTSRGHGGGHPGYLDGPAHHPRNHRAARRARGKRGLAQREGVLDRARAGYRPRIPGARGRRHQQGGFREEERNGRDNLRGEGGRPGQRNVLRLERLRQRRPLGRLHGDSDGLWAGLHHAGRARGGHLDGGIIQERVRDRRNAALHLHVRGKLGNLHEGGTAMVLLGRGRLLVAARGPGGHARRRGYRPGNVGGYVRTSGGRR